MAEAKEDVRASTTGTRYCGRCLAKISGKHFKCDTCADQTFCEACVKDLPEECTSHKMLQQDDVPAAAGFALFADAMMAGGATGDDGGEVYLCDTCMAGISGKRYHCDTCVEADYCDECFGMEGNECVTEKHKTVVFGAEEDSPAAAATTDAADAEGADDDT